ncbi:HNH endonuclease [Bacillus phage Pascal]|uniref:HNH homing endonuclease n=1 Tax=Bacillus phage Pascal TaxID=1540092 RepID=A0A0A0RNS8_9CAUD|nr:HNH endonuclease [Bacillus phage Pascal]AIW03682.1 HNH homing endonuclease [Bacillus phage Pascal]
MKKIEFGFHPVAKPVSNVVKRKDSSGKNRYYIAGDCEKCGEYFEKRKDGAKHSNLCSSCALKESNARRKGTIIESRRNGKTKKCAVCNEEYYVKASRLSSKYCSSKCWNSVKPLPAAFITKTNNAGKNNGRYKDGKRTGERAKQNTPKNKVRQQVKERDGNWCLLCGKPPSGLHLHRIKYGSQGGKYEKDNCVQLCNEDHALIHTDKKLFMPLLESYIKLATANQLESEPTEPPFYWYDWIKEFKGALDV